jgi:hypothetical protein
MMEGGAGRVKRCKLTETNQQQFSDVPSESIVAAKREDLALQAITSFYVVISVDYIKAGICL